MHNFSAAFIISLPSQFFRFLLENQYLTAEGSDLPFSSEEPGNNYKWDEYNLQRIIVGWYCACTENCLFTQVQRWATERKSNCSRMFSNIYFFRGKENIAIIHSLFKAVWKIIKRYRRGACGVPIFLTWINKLLVLSSTCPLSLF